MAVPGRAAGDPDVLLGGHRRQAVDLGHRVQHGLVADDGEAVDLLAVATAVGDDVVHLAVVGQDVHVHVFRLHRVHLDRFGVEPALDGEGDHEADLIQVHARHVHGAVDAEVERAVGPDEVLAANRLVG